MVITLTVLAMNGLSPLSVIDYVSAMYVCSLDDGCPVWSQAPVYNTAHGTIP